jgi:hypothetical protein
MERKQNHPSHHSRASDKDSLLVASLPKERRSHLGESIKPECPEIAGMHNQEPDIQWYQKDEPLKIQ